MSDRVAAGDEAAAAPASAAAAPLLNRRLLLLMPFLLLGSFSHPLLKPSLTIVQQEWWVGTISPGFTCGDVPSDVTACKDALSKSALAQSVTTSVSALISFFLSPLVGRLSDSYGRKPIIIVSAIMRILQPITLVLNDQLGISFYFYYIASVLLAQAPGMIAVMAYIADVSAVEHRAASFSMVMGVHAVSSCVGPFLSTGLSNIQIFLTCLSISAAHLLYAVFLLPETLPSESRRELHADAWNPIKSMAILNRTPLFRKLALVVFLSFFVLSGSIEVNDLFARARFNFSKKDNVINLEISGFSGLFVQLAVLPLLAYCLAPRRILLVGLVCQCASQVLHALVTTKLFVFFVTGFSALGSVCFPAVSAIKSANVDESEQGTIQGALGSIHALAGIVGPLAFGGLFTWGNSTLDLPQLPFYVGAGILLVSIALSARVPRRGVADADATGGTGDDGVVGGGAAETPEFEEVDMKLLGSSSKVASVLADDVEQEESSYLILSSGAVCENASRQAQSQAGEP